LGEYEKIIPGKQQGEKSQIEGPSFFHNGTLHKITIAAAFGSKIDTAPSFRIAYLQPNCNFLNFAALCR
jgi:hypothetical protein